MIIVHWVSDYNTDPPNQECSDYSLASQKGRLIALLVLIPGKLLQYLEMYSR